MISFAVAALRQCARDSGIADGFYEQHQEILDTFAMRIASLQRTKDRQAIRAWYFDKSKTKDQLFEVLDD
jgi:hypothetical protein